MKLKYNGVLTDTQVDHIRSAIRDGYTFFVETKRFVDPEVVDLEERKWYRTHDMDAYAGITEATHVREGKRYWITSRNYAPDTKDEGRFYGFMDDKDRQKFVKRFPHDIANPDPFTMEFVGPKPKSIFRRLWSH